MDAELLLFLVSENKELFDKNHSEYKNTKRKEVLWQGIADKMGVDGEFCWCRFLCSVTVSAPNHQRQRVCVCVVEEVKAKWKNLRDTYTRKKRMEQDGSLGGRAAKKKKQWKYMRVMDFLDPSTEHRRYSRVFHLSLLARLQSLEKQTNSSLFDFTECSLLKSNWQRWRHCTVCFYVWYWSVKYLFIYFLVSFVYQVAFFTAFEIFKLCLK